MRLIDADKLKNHYSWWNNEEKELFDSIVDAQPTAFDLDKVVQELEEEKKNHERQAEEELDEFCLEMYHLHRDCAYGIEIAIELVKAGGIDERD